MMRSLIHTPYALIFMLMAALLLLGSHMLVGAVGTMGLGMLALFKKLQCEVHAERADAARNRPIWYSSRRRDKLLIRNIIT